MADLSTRYMGMDLKNPIIIGSSRLTSTLEGVKACEGSGAGAVVLKSIFEEQIEADSSSMIQGLDDLSVHADAYDFFHQTSKDHYIDTYLELVEQAKKSVSIPVIASVNCVNPGSWLDYSHRFEEVGADGLEINMFIVPSQAAVSSIEIERRYYDLVRQIRRHTKLPIALKIGSHFTAMAHVMKTFDEMGVNALVLFNRYYKTDIDIETLKLKAGKVISVPEEAALTMQWTAMMSEELSCDVCANTGIHDGETVIKQLLAGASSIQVCSAVMKQGHGVIAQMLATMTDWMDKKGYASISDFKGLLSQERSDSPEVWERSQYIKAVCGIS